jgi:hypothetical protein
VADLLLCPNYLSREIIELMYRKNWRTRHQYFMANEYTLETSQFVVTYFSGDVSVLRIDSEKPQALRSGSWSNMLSSNAVQVMSIRFLQ